MSRPLPTSRPGRLLAGPAVYFLLVLSPAAVAAHDFWLEPWTWDPAPESTLRIGLRVGEAFAGEPVRRSARHIDRFVVAGPKGERTVPGPEGRDPAGLVPIGGAGIYAVGYQSTGSPITLPASPFESYLEHEGLEHVVRIRRERGESRAAGREEFLRSAKSLVRAGAAAGGWDLRLGLALELVPENDPFAPTDEGLVLRLLFHGEPVSGVLVRLRHAQRPDEPAAGRTDEGGRVRLAAGTAPGPRLVTAVHMARVDADGIDWRSHWASLTYSVPATAPADSDPVAPHRR